MTTTNFHTDLFRDVTFDLLSDVADKPTTFYKLTNDYLTKLKERNDVDDLRQYTRDIYDKISSSAIVQSTSNSQLRDSIHGKIVVILFWTFSDIHCSHVIPKLTGIHKRCSKAGVTVIGVHSPKYEHEKNTIHICDTIKERSITFDVINDNGVDVWKHVGCELWPTVLIFGPDELPIFIFEGENHVQYTEIFLLPVLGYYESNITIAPISPSTIGSSVENILTTDSATDLKNFSYPSHICVTSDKHIYISFPTLNQLIVCEIDGKIIDAVGSGQSGMADGDIHQVQFDSPRGLAEYNNCIYIADTNNHAIRVYDPHSRRVVTLIGTGRLGTDKVGGLKPGQQPIASPWGLCTVESPFDHKTVLLISMAGHHQIWAYAFEETEWWNDKIIPKYSCSAIVGSGIQGNQNGHDPMSVRLAAPRGICSGKMNRQAVLFIADSNSSSIRVVTLKNGNVANLAGGDPDPQNLLAFGDLDGSNYSAKLQHPLDVAYHYPSSQLYVSDSYNNKLKSVDMKTLVCSSYFVTDSNETMQTEESKSAEFHEPQSLTIFENYMFVADKHKSHIKRIDLNDGTMVRCQFDLSETLGNERSFNSKQAYLSIALAKTLQLRGGQIGTWSIEDPDGFKICGGELSHSVSDQMLLGYIPRDKHVSQLKYQLVVCEDDKCRMMSGEVQPINQTNSAVEFFIKVDL